jgi:hypothetical protein
VPLCGWVGRRCGLRRLLVAGYGTAGVMTIATAVAFHRPSVGAGMLVLAGFGAELIDGAGNLLFLRAVHPYERSEPYRFSRRLFGLTHAAKAISWRWVMA